jgi:phenylpropionate dioxygenase-like ring-hydroxylating dioxygenase large terminal subunit
MNAPQRPYVQRYAHLGTGPLGTEPMTSPAYFERERELIFRRAWLNVCRADDIPEPGDYLVKNVQTLRASIILVRGDDGKVRAFHNACRHRGNQVADGCGKRAAGFACGFHGWAYDRQGALQYVPDEEQFFDLPKAELGLKPVHCDTWAGFVFVNFAQRPAWTLDAYLGELGTGLGDYPFHTLVPIARYQARVKANWKVFIDAFQESYHAAFVHRLSAAGVGGTNDDPYTHLSSVRLLGPHRAASVPMNPAYVPPPTEALSFKYASSLWLQADAREQRFPPGANPERHANWLFDINVLFPHFFIDVASGWYFTYHFWPVAVDETFWEYAFYMAEPQSAGERISREYSRIALRDVLREDHATVERTQAALMSGAVDRIWLSDQEIAVRHQYAVVEAWLSTPTLGPTPPGA